jgi:hypothetical protein
MTQGRPELELVFPTRDDPVAPAASAFGGARRAEAIG